MRIPISYLEPSTEGRTFSRCVLYISGILSLFGFLVVPVPAAAVESVNGSGGGMLPVLLTVVMGAIAVAALTIAGLVYWGRKEDHLGEMVHFCLKFLIHSEDEAERCASARALGKANDPGALLVLLDVTLDEEEMESVRKAASEALHEVGTNLRKHKEIITDLEFAAEQGNFRGIIEILIANFERGRKTYAQSAYLIARQYMRLECYLDARDWLMKAELRNRRFNLYGNQIRRWIELCNIRLLEEADSSYKEADYQHAKERYAVLDHDLSMADKQQTSVYLRTACVYVKLKDYRNADQSLLLALAQNHDTELALTLVPLLQEILGSSNKQVEQNDKLEAIHNTIDMRASEIMNVLLARKF